MSVEKIGISNESKERAVQEGSHYNSLFKNNYVIMLCIDPQTAKIIDANLAACTFYGYEYLDLITMTIDELNIFTEEQIHAEMQLAKNEQRNYFHFQHRLANGQVRDVEVFSSPIIYQGKKLLYSIIHDITEINKAAEKMSQINHNLEKIISERTSELEEINAELEEMNAELEERNRQLEEEITQRKKAEEKLRKSITVIQDLYENAPCGYHSSDKNGFFIKINQTELTWLGYTKEELVGKKKLIDLITPAGKEIYAKHYASLIKHGVIKDLEFELMTRSGVNVPVLLNATVVKDCAGNFVMSRATIIDITQRKKFEAELNALNLLLERMVLERTNQLQEANAELEETNAMLEEEIYERSLAEEALRKSEERYRSVYENSPLAFGIWDNEFRFVDWNKRAEEMFGWSKEEVLGKRFVDFFVPPEVRSQVRDVTKDILLTGLNRVTAHENVTKDGRVLYCEWHNTLLHDDEGRLIGVISLGLDKTESRRASKALIAAKEQAETVNVELSKSNAALKAEIAERMKIEEALRKSKAEAEQANIAKSQFLANMSHEIRTPMNGIIGMTDLTLMTDLKAEQRDYLNIVKSSTGNLLRVINDILDYSKIEAGKVMLESLPFDMHVILSEVIDLFAISAKQKGLKIKVKFDPRIPPMFLGDPFRLRQVLSNLVGNGIKFTAQGEINIIVEVEEQHEDRIKLRFVVADTGIGIAENKLEKLFKRFSQVDDSKAKLYGGTGLGLAISKMLIEMMGGCIGVESKENVGSSFFFTSLFRLPENILDLKSTEKVSYERIDLNFLKPVFKKVLLAEDDLVSKNIMKIILEKHGFDVFAVDNGIDAVSAFEKERFDLIIMDINMPLMDGYQATALIRLNEQKQAVRSHIPIIAMTAYALRGDREKCLKAGMDDYLSKPINICKVSNLLRKYAEHGKISTFDEVKDEERDLDSFERTVLALMKASGFERQLSEELVRDFCEQAEAILADIHKYFENSELQEVSILLHKLKGSSGSVRALEVYQAALDAEKALGRKNIATTKSLLRKIQAALADLDLGR